MLEKLAFSAVFLLFPLLILLSYRSLGLRLLEVNILNIVVVSLFLFSYFGILPLYFYWDDYRFNIGVVDREVITYMLLASSWSIFSIVLVFGVLGKVARVPIRRRADVDARGFSSTESIACTFVFLLCSVVFYIYINAVDQVALFVALFGDGESVAGARSAMTNAFHGDYHWYNFFLSDISVYISFCFYANSLLRKNSASSLLFGISFLLTSFFLLSTAQKAPIVWYFVGLFFVHSIVLHGGFVSLKGVMYSAIIGLLILVVLYGAFMGVDDLLSGLKSIFSRIFSASISASYFYFEFFPDEKPYLLGATMPNPGGILPFEPYPLTTELMKWRFPDSSSEAVIGSSPTVFWGEAYANFAWVGIIFVPFIMGLIIYSYHFLVSYLENTPFKIALIAWLALFFKDVSVTGFSSFFVNLTFFCLLILVAFLIVASNAFVFKYIR